MFCGEGCKVYSGLGVLWMRLPCALLGSLPGELLGALLGGMLLGVLWSRLSGLL